MYISFVGSSRFDPRTFTRSHSKYGDGDHGLFQNGRAPSYSDNSTYHLSNLNISDISLVEGSPLIGIGMYTFKYLGHHYLKFFRYLRYS